MSREVFRAEIVLPIVMLIVLVSVGWTRMDQTDKRTWEHKYLQLSSSQTHEYEVLLSQQGYQRWELVAVVREDTGGTTHFYFKRPR
ncbi:MAG TPA: hypothetical protein VFD48_06045 [Pyrinomonadaceae bacterium]|nr:hypothetical protein [Pyrinomonadaceae bacterium]